MVISGLYFLRLSARILKVLQGYHATYLLESESSSHLGFTLRFSLLPDIARDLTDFMAKYLDKYRWLFNTRLTGHP
jgi:hypothetical protein